MSPPAASDSVAPSLRHWLIAHFVVSALLGVPLFLFPGFSLHLLGWVEVDGALSRIVAAAMVASGVTSWRWRNEGARVLRALLTLNGVWSGLSALGIGYGVWTGAAPLAALLVAGGFAVFALAWGVHLARATAPSSRGSST